MIKESGMSAGRVPLKLLQPMIENGSLEEDDGLQDKWAALLANAATKRDDVHPSFIEILKQLSSIEAIFLDVLSERDRRRSVYQRQNEYVSTEFKQAEDVIIDRLMELTNEDRGTVHGRFREMEITNNLLRLGIAQPPNRVEAWQLTDFGKAFVAACQSPKKKTDEKYSE